LEIWRVCHLLEAIRQMRHELGRDDILNIHVTLLPYIKTADELKTKPTQHSVQELRRLGITPQMLILRAEETIPNEIKRKIAFTCDIDEESVIEAVDAPTIYQVPLNFKIQDILNQIAKHLNLENVKPDMREWHELVRRIVEPKYRTKIAFVGKYLDLKESY